MMKRILIVGIILFTARVGFAQLGIFVEPEKRPYWKNKEVDKTNRGKGFKEEKRLLKLSKSESKKELRTARRYDRDIGNLSESESKKDLRAARRYDRDIGNLSERGNNKNGRGKLRSGSGLSMSSSKRRSSFNKVQKKRRGKISLTKN